MVEPMMCVSLTHYYSLNSLNLIKRSVNEWCPIKREKIISGAEIKRSGAPEFNQPTLLH